MQELTIITHLGLGDLILQSGLAVHLAKDYDRVYFPCRRRDFNSVRSFFLLQPKIEVVPLDTDSTTPEDVEIKSPFLPLGFYSTLAPDPALSFAENFYLQAGVSYDVRWDECPIQEVVDVFYGGEYMFEGGCFSHDDRDRGFVIKAEHLPVYPIRHMWVKPGSSSILSYAPIMRQADFIEVIDSAFLHLAESIETRGELYLHEYARQSPYPGSKCPTRKKWTVLK